MNMETAINPRMSIGAPSSEDDAVATYTQVAENRVASELDSWFKTTIGEAPAKPAGAAPAAAGSSGNPDLDALMNGGVEAPPAAAISGLRPFNPGEMRDNGNGSYSTEITTTWQTPDGAWVNVPSLWKDPSGKNVQFNPDDEDGILGAMQEFEAMGGQAFPRFKSVDEATAFAEKRSASGGASSGDAQLAGYTPVPEEKSLASSVASTLLSVGKDVGAGLASAPRQVVGGVIDAFGEMDQFMQELVPIGGMELFDAEGNFDPSLISADEMKAQNKAEQDLFSKIAPANPDTVTGQFVRSTAQFLTGFIPGMQATKGMQAMKGGAMLSSMAAGAVADMVVFDPNEDRLSTFLNQIPALSSVVPDWLASTDDENSPLMGRVKNAIEGAGLGMATDGLVTAFKYYKAARAAKAANKLEADPLGATVEAAKDELKAAARTELVQDIPDEALHGLGDAAPDAPLIVEAPMSETASAAFTRLGEAKIRSEKAIVDNNALTAINDISQRFAKGAAPGRDPMDEMIDNLRSSAGINAKIPRRPVSEIVKGLGGVDPTSSFAGDLRSRGITAKSFPGLFKKDGGLKSLDNIPASEHPIFTARNSIDPDTGYIPQQDFIDGLEAELKGDPWMTAETQARYDDMIAPLEDLEKHLDQLGIDYKNMSNESVKARITQIADEEAAAARVSERAPEGAETAGPERWDEEAVAKATADGVDPAIIAAHSPPKVYINLARINSADDVKATLQTMLDMDAANVVDKTRGVVSNQQTIKESSQEYRDLNDLIGRPPGPMNAAQAVAARKLLASSGEQIVQLAKVAQAPNATPADLFAFRRAMAVHYAIQSEVVAARTETARALQSWAIPAGASKARSQAIAELISFGGGAGDIQELAKAVATADSATKINVMARELGRGKFGKAMYQVWINGLLSSPKTHAVNILSNSMVAFYAIPERYMAAGISKAFYNGEIEAGEAVAQAFGLMKGIRDGARLVALGNKAEGRGGVSDVFDNFAKTDGVTPNAISSEAFGLDPAGGFGYGIDILSKIVNAPGSALNAEDKFFKTIGYRMELNALAHRTAAGEGLEGKEFASRVVDILNNPPEQLKADALDTAAYQTFTNPLSAKARQALGGINGIKYVGSVFRVVVPFVKTPTNILKFTFARTPLAYMSGIIQADIKAGGPRAAQAHARVAMGTMILMSVVDMAMEGTITGAGPMGGNTAETQKLRKAKMDTGWMPYSVKVGDRWYQYNRLDPIASIIGLGADMAEIGTNADEADFETLVAGGAIALAQNLASKTYMRGIYDFIGNIDPNNPSSDLGGYLTNLTTGLVPYSSFLRNLNGVTDDVMRETRTTTYGDDSKIDQVATYLDNFQNKIRKGIPGLSDELPPMRDLWGEEITKASGIGWAWDFVSPIASKADDPDPVTKIILDNRVDISSAPRVIAGVKLSAAEYSEFVELAGKPAKEQLDELITAPGFDKLTDGPDGMKAEIIRDVVNGARERAAAMMQQKHPELRERSFAAKQEQMRSLTGQ